MLTARSSGNDRRKGKTGRDRECGPWACMGAGGQSHVKLGVHSLIGMVAWGQRCEDMRALFTAQYVPSRERSRCGWSGGGGGKGDASHTEGLVCHAEAA